MADSLERYRLLAKELRYISNFENESDTINVWYIYLHLLVDFLVNVVKYTSPMDGMGMISFAVIPRNGKPKLRAGQSLE